MSTPSDLRADDNAGLIPDDARACIEAFAAEKGLSTARVMRQFLLYMLANPLCMEDAVSAETLGTQLRHARLARREQREQAARVELRARYLQAGIGARCGTFTHHVERIATDTYFGCLLCDEGDEGTRAIYRHGDEAVLINGHLVCGVCVNAHVPVRVRPHWDGRPADDGDALPRFVDSNGEPLPSVVDSNDLADIPF